LYLVINSLFVLILHHINILPNYLTVTATVHFGKCNCMFNTVHLESRCALRLRYRGCPCTLNELRTAITVYIRNVSQADLQKMFANKIKQVQACIDARGHHFQRLL
jgi:hypothetical protein